VFRQKCGNFKNSRMNLKGLKAVFFDMDGVLFDSMPAHADCWVRSFNMSGLNFTHEQAYMNEGRTGSGTINLAYNAQYGRNATQVEIDTIYGNKTILMEQWPDGGIIQGMPEVISFLQSKHIELWVVTGSSQKMLLAKLNTSFPGVFSEDRMVTGFDVIHGKPHPEPYLMALHKSGYKPEETVVIENAPLGIESAKAAGLKCMAINTGVLSDKILADEGADIVVKTAAQLLTIFIDSLTN